MKMEKPTVSNPRKATWVTDDRQLKRLLDHLFNRTLNTDRWSIHCFSIGKEVRYPDLIKRMHDRYPDIETIDIARDFVIGLPKKMEITREDLQRVFKAFLINADERINYIKALEKYCSHLEKRLASDDEPEPEQDEDDESVDVPEPEKIPDSSDARPPDLSSLETESEEEDEDDEEYEF